MLLTVVFEPSIFSFSVEPDLEIEGLKALIEVETGLLIQDQQLSFQRKILADNTKTLSQEAILADEVLVLTRRTPRTDNQVFPGALPSAMDDVDYQKKIESEIIQKNIQDNLASAYEFHPETFANVSMLYISCLVNDLPVKAFVDCGAQVTILTKKCAERLGLARLIDTRFTGVAAGVGQATIYGKIHSALLSMNGRSLNLHCSFTVLDHMEEPEMLLGLDMMRRFQACIDLENNVLRIHGTDVPFLPESEIPTHMAQLAASQMTSLVPSQQQSSSVGNKLGTSKSASREMKESDIDALMKIVPSITREKAKNALVRADGNVDLAASILLGL